jgi:hypothetical protein
MARPGPSSGDRKELLKAKKSIETKQVCLWPQLPPKLAERLCRDALSYQKMPLQKRSKL